jgi:hypothetical protein
VWSTITAYIAWKTDRFGATGTGSSRTFFFVICHTVLASHHQLEQLQNFINKNLKQRRRPRDVINQWSRIRLDRHGDRRLSSMCEDRATGSQCLLKQQRSHQYSSRYWYWQRFKFANYLRI